MASPVSLAEATQHLRLANLNSAELIELTNMVEASTRYAEAITKRDLGGASESCVFDGFPSPYKSPRRDYFRIPNGPVTSVDSFTYVNDSTYGTETLTEGTDFRAVTKNNVTYLYPYFGVDWPTDCADEPGSVTITVTHTAAGSSPDIALIKMAILMIVGALYENREDGVIDQGIVKIRAPIAARDLLSSLRTR